MSHDLLQDSRFHASLTAIDHELAEGVRRVGCPCGGPLHTGDYPRKPRGSAVLEANEAWGRRLSLCCGREGCRKRATPPSVRFMGRRVYVGLAIVWGCARVGRRVSVATVEELRDIIGVSARTVYRWLAWWRRTLVSGAWWSRARARFLPPVEDALLPASLLERFAMPSSSPMELLLQFIAPLTTESVRVM